MVTLEDLRREKRAAILAAARKHGAREIRVYGSVARGEATDQSDLDLLVDWEPCLASPSISAPNGASTGTSAMKSFARPCRCEASRDVPELLLAIENFF